MLVTHTQVGSETKLDNELDCIQLMYKQCPMLVFTLANGNGNNVGDEVYNTVQKYLMRLHHQSFLRFKTKITTL